MLSLVVTEKIKYVLLAHNVKDHSVSGFSCLQAHQHLLGAAPLHLVKVHLLQVLCRQPSENHSEMMILYVSCNNETFLSL